MVVKQDRPRYILVEFKGDCPDKKKLIWKLRDKVSQLGGALTLAESNLHIIDTINNYAIIRAQHQSRDIIEVAIQLLDFKNAIPVVRTVSGTIKTINEKLSTNFEDKELEELQEEDD